MKKTSVKITTNGISYTDVIETPKTTRKHTHYISVASIDSSMLTDTAHAYMYKCAVKMTYTALKTIYTRTAHETIRNLMNECVQIACTDLAQRTVYVDDNSVTHSAQQLKKHSHKKSNGMLIEIEPWYELEFTEYGKQYNVATDVNIDIANVECMDLINTAYCKMLELVNMNMITDFDSVYVCSKLIYKAVNDVIHAQQKKPLQYDSKHNDMLLTVNPYNNKTVYLDTHSENTETKALVTSIIDSAKNVLMSYLDSRCNSENISKVFDLCYIHGYTQKECADILNVSKMTVTRYIAQLEKIATNAQVNELLHEILC